MPHPRPKVMLDPDLAELYHVATKALNHAVHRNFDRFPLHFMFQQSKEELRNWRSQIVTSNPFTEHGVMLASVLEAGELCT